jgi:general stress protein CsbA
MDKYYLTTNNIKYNITQMSYVAIILISALFGALLYYMAGIKGYNKQFWLIMGILFGPFALPFIILGKKKE